MNLEFLGILLNDQFWVDAINFYEQSYQVHNAHKSLNYSLRAIKGIRIDTNLSYEYRKHKNG